MATTPNLLATVRSHLEFLGYSFKEEDILIGRHASKPLIAVGEYKAGILFTAVYFATEAAGDDELGFLRFVNEGNRKAQIARYITYENDFITAEAWFPDHYERVPFGAFFEGWLDEMKTFLADETGPGRKYLK